MFHRGHSLLASILMVITLSNSSYSASSSDQPAFDLSKQSLGLRQSYCQQNIAYCRQSCYNKAPALPTINTCNPASMEWSCVCADGHGFGGLNVHQFPIQIMQCQGEQQQCYSSCIVAGAAQSDIENSGQSSSGGGGGIGSTASGGSGARLNLSTEDSADDSEASTTRAFVVLPFVLLGVVAFV
ncbi:hypothetical protein SeMB42_g03798 [Synchytrium endobioticum]|uniref:DUF7707 domain-containing protein n=1 Tax=Synchytrium endobioticum TaxID=286115 RepID=A0A507CY24_9FUNG|nr:hypothetical protein SeLEV6574_g04751 [Synchytrium endobioticum]TPX46220.1 hypothetical protein SeMB42_g03798 [Synchytrium endobioticum]